MTQITITRIITFDQYVASNRLYSLHSTFRYKFNFVLFLYVMPILSLFALPVLVWQAIDTWQHTLGALRFGVLVGVTWMFLWLLAYPLLFRRKLRKLYKLQPLDRPHTTVFSEQDIHTDIPGQLETRFQWGYFDVFLEDDTFFILIKKARPIFISVAKPSLPEDQQAELRALLAAKLPPATR